jgi:hypothetical protein
MLNGCSMEFLATPLMSRPRRTPMQILSREMMRFLDRNDVRQAINEAIERGPDSDGLYRLRLPDAVPTPPQEGR